MVRSLCSIRFGVWGRNSRKMRVVEIQGEGLTRVEREMRIGLIPESCFVEKRVL
jgi:hypothetical protein